MKVCVTSSGASEEDQMDPRFGRCKYFVLFDLHTREVQAFENSSMDASGGAGIQAAQFVAGKGAAVVLTGHVGPNAFRTLTAAGIAVFTGAAGTVKNSIDAYESGKLTKASDPDSSSKSGMRS